MNIKRLVLGTAAGALAVTGAQAADLPVVVEPVDYVRICDAFGAGFYFIPGTETCLSVRGRIRADYNVFFDDERDDFEIRYRPPSNPNRPFSDGLFLRRDFGSDLSTPNFDSRGYDDNDQDGYRFRARGYIYMDSRTSTEFGLLRTFTEVHFTRDGNDSVSTNLNRAFIQFGGLTFGRTQSFYDFTDAYYGTFQLHNPSVSDTSTNVIAYTAAFGNGFSASISLEDEVRRRNFIGFSPVLLVPRGTGPNPNDGDVFLATSDARYQGRRIPDIVANVRVEQGWGSAQIMGALHYVDVIGTVTRVNAAGNVIVEDASDEELGWAVGGGVNVNIPFGAGTTAGIQATYAEGALNYLGADSFVPGSFVAGADAIVDLNGSMDKAQGFSIHGGFATSFTPTVSLTLGGGYTYVDYDDYTLARNLVTGETITESADFQNFDVDGFIGWSPISGFVMGVGAQFKYQDSDEFDDASSLSAFFRAQRTF